jgi:predicted P-loop ATPase
MTMTSTPTQTPQIDICEAIIQNIGYGFRLNVVTDRIETYGKKNCQLDDKLFKFIAAEVSRHYKSTTEQLDIAINDLAYKNQYHPIKNYLNSLSYDGGPHFQRLVSCFDNSDKLFSTWLRKWLIGVVAKTVTGAQNPMLVINGPQGIGKSKFASWLCSKVPNYFIESTINTDDKDTFDMLASCWIWEVSELGASLRRSDFEALKHFITMARVSIRPAYGKYTLTRPALASMIGTINDRGGGVYDDPTGSRRFLMCDVEKINWQEYTQIDVNQLWAEIYAAYLLGETWLLTEKEKEIQENKNLEYQPKDTLEDHLVSGFDIDNTKDFDDGFFTPTTVIIEYLQEIKKFKAGSTMTLNKMIAQTCKHLGLKPDIQLVNPPINPQTNAPFINQVPKRMRGYSGIKKS